MIIAKEFFFSPSLSLGNNFDPVSSFSSLFLAEESLHYPENQHRAASHLSPSTPWAWTMCGSPTDASISLPLSNFSALFFLTTANLTHVMITCFWSVSNKKIFQVLAVSTVGCSWVLSFLGMGIFLNRGKKIKKPGNVCSKLKQDRAS